MKLDRHKEFVWSPFHVSLRQTLGKLGPAGVGARLFVWDTGLGWIFNLDLLLGPWDVQLGVHTNGCVEKPAPLPAPPERKRRGRR